MGTPLETRVQSFRVLLTPLTYIPVGHIDIDKSAGKPICTGADCREAGGHRDVPDETCEVCGGAVKIIACIEDPTVIQRILDHLDRQTTSPPSANAHAARAPPQLMLPGLNE